MTSNKVNRVSSQQLEILWEFLSSHRDVAVGFNRSLQSKEYSTKKWKEVAQILNSQGVCAHKDWRGWSKYWVDYKAKLKRKVSLLRAEQRQSGSTPYIDPPFSELEEKFLQVLGDDFGQGLPGGREPLVVLQELSDSTVEVDSPLPLPHNHVDPSIESESRESHTATSPLSRGDWGETDIVVDGGPTTMSVSPQSSLRRTSADTVPSPRPTMPPRRRKISHQTARRILIRTSQIKADAAMRSCSVLERMAEGIERIAQIQEGILNTLGRVERSINAGLSRNTE